MKHIRNFSIIAHIDHGKSTLADRMLEMTGTISARDMREQVLDSMELERERGITIKMQPVRMEWGYKNIHDRSRDDASVDVYTLNLIDTPGHVDFSYEVSRAMSAVEGAVLLVDATQGVEAQTLSVLHIAREEGLAIIPVLSKVDAPAARTDDVRLEVAELLACDPDDVLLTSGKTGEGVPELLDAIVEHIPEPQGQVEGDVQALVFDFDYSDHRGVIVYVRVFGGEVHSRDDLRFAAGDAPFVALDMGVLTPRERTTGVLSAGEIGYIVTGIKKPGIASVGDTVTSRTHYADPLPGYREPQPVIWASLYPEEETAARSSDAFASLRQALERLSLTDSSLSWEEEQSGVLGRGFRCGFLGMLHLEIVTERLRREFGLSITVTSPSVAYVVKHDDKGEERVYTPSRFPDHGAQVSVFEPWVLLSIMTPPEHVGAVSQLLVQHEAITGETEQQVSGRMRVFAEMPLRELMRNFVDKLTSATSGYASVSYEHIGDRPADVARVDVLVAEEPVPALARVVSARRIEEESRAVVERLRELLPAQQFVLKIQAKARGRIIASERIAARRKDVTGYLYGGDVTRKMKLLEKQKKGKKRLASMGKVRIPQDVYMRIMRDQ
jgi:GTP-binding protein LepA